MRSIKTEVQKTCVLTFRRKNKTTPMLQVRASNLTIVRLEPDLFTSINSDQWARFAQRDNDDCGPQSSRTKHDIDLGETCCERHAAWSSRVTQLSQACDRTPFQTYTIRASRVRACCFL